MVERAPKVQKGTDTQRHRRTVPPPSVKSFLFNTLNTDLREGIIVNVRRVEPWGSILLPAMHKCGRALATATTLFRNIRWGGWGGGGAVDAELAQRNVAAPRFIASRRTIMNFRCMSMIGQASDTPPRVGSIE